MTEEDRLPKIMCGECTYKLDLISDFRDKAYKTETLLLSKLDLDIVKPEVKNSMQDQYYIINLALDEIIILAILGKISI